TRYIHDRRYVSAWKLEPNPMTESPHNPAPHLSEGELLRYLDSEMTGGERASVAAHLLACRACSAALDAVREAKEQFAVLLVDLPVPAIDPARRAAALASVERAA